MFSDCRIRNGGANISPATTTSSSTPSIASASSSSSSLISLQHPPQNGLSSVVNRLVISVAHGNLPAILRRNISSESLPAGDAEYVVKSNDRDPAGSIY